MRLSRQILYFITFLWLAIVCVSARAETMTSGTLAITGDAPRGHLVCLSLYWTADATTTTVIVSGTFDELSGTIERLEFTPDTSTLAKTPTSAYDMTITDAGGYDILCGSGGNLSNSAVKNFAPTINDGTRYYPLATSGRHTISVSNTKPGSSGWLRIFFRR